MPWSLERRQYCGDLHFVTFSCFRRRALFDTAAKRDFFEETLEKLRVRHGFYIHGYVVMPEHIHMILSEPDVQPLATSVQILKQDVSRKLNSGFTAFWEKRYHDFNVYTNRKRVEKLRYLHRNPVKRGLVDAPERWKWSSFHHYATGDIGTVEIESPWTANRRAGIINLSLEHPVLVG